LIGRSVVAFGLMLLMTIGAFAQNDDAISTFTPYSFYGVGDLMRPGTPYNRAMGGIGTGVRTSRQINFLNPAALTAHDSLAFMIDFGFESQNFYSAYTGADNELRKSASNSINVHHIVMCFPITRKLVVGVGLFPYSNVGYKMQSIETRPKIIAEMGNIYYQYQGEGGINQVALSFGYAINKRLSVGAQGQYYFGAIDRYSSTIFSNPYFSNQVTEKSLKVGNFGAALGAQYDRPLNKNLQMTIGATYQLSTSLGSRYLDATYVYTGALIDTISPNDKKGFISIPHTISAGFSIRKGDLWMAGLEYVYQHWNDKSLDDTSFQQIKFTVNPSHLFRAGFEWTPRRHDFRNYLNRCTYRIGFNYEKTYMNFNDRQINDFGATIGFGFPINRWNTGINVAAEIGQRGTTQHRLIRETYFKFSVSFSLYDIWFFKHQID